MKQKPSKHLEQYRIRGGELASDETFGNNGAFAIPLEGFRVAVILCSDKFGWDHVSVHIDTPNGQRCPIWDELDYVRALVFRGDEWVMQLHAPASKHINMHPHTLHLWRPQDQEIPVPLGEFV